MTRIWADTRCSRFLFKLATVVGAGASCTTGRVFLILRANSLPRLHGRYFHTAVKRGGRHDRQQEVEWRDQVTYLVPMSA